MENIFVLFLIMLYLCIYKYTLIFLSYFHVSKSAFLFIYVLWCPHSCAVSTSVFIMAIASVFQSRPLILLQTLIYNPMFCYFFSLQRRYMRCNVSNVGGQSIVHPADLLDTNQRKQNSPFDEADLLDA